MHALPKLLDMQQKKIGSFLDLLYNSNAEFAEIIQEGEASPHARVKNDNQSI